MSSHWEANSTGTTPAACTRSSGHMEWGNMSYRPQPCSINTSATLLRRHGMDSHIQVSSQIG